MKEIVKLFEKYIDFIQETVDLNVYKDKEAIKYVEEETDKVIVKLYKLKNKYDMDM